MADNGLQKVAERGNFRRLIDQIQMKQGGQDFHTGQVNPMWLEWLMGYPANHTELKHSETPSSRKSRKSSRKKSLKPKGNLPKTKPKKRAKKNEK